MEQLKQRWSDVKLMMMMVRLMMTMMDSSSRNLWTCRSVRLQTAPPAVLLWIKD